MVGQNLDASIMGSNVLDKSSTSNDKQNDKQKPDLKDFKDFKCVWTLEADEALINSLAIEISQGHHTSKSIKSIAWLKILQSVQKIDKNVQMFQIKSHYYDIRRWYRLWLEVNRRPEFKWDQPNGKFIANDFAWDALIKANRRYKIFKKRKMPYLTRLHTIFPSKIPNTGASIKVRDSINEVLGNIDEVMDSNTDSHSQEQLQSQMNIMDLRHDPPPPPPSLHDHRMSNGIINFSDFSNINSNHSNNQNHNQNHSQVQLNNNYQLDNDLSIGSEISNTNNNTNTKPIQLQSPKFNQSSSMPLNPNNNNNNNNNSNNNNNNNNNDKTSELQQPSSNYNIQTLSNNLSSPMDVNISSLVSMSNIGVMSMSDRTTSPQNHNHSSSASNPLDNPNVNSLARSNLLPNSNTNPMMNMSRSSNSGIGLMPTRVQQLATLNENRNKLIVNNSSMSSHNNSNNNNINSLNGLVNHNRQESTTNKNTNSTSLYNNDDEGTTTIKQLEEREKNFFQNLQNYYFENKLDKEVFFDILYNKCGNDFQPLLLLSEVLNSEVFINFLDYQYKRKNN